MATFSIVDALSTLCTSIPGWNSRLEELNGQIALRQIELARLTDSERPPTARSLKNKGSTESLRPKDGENENPFSNNDDIPNDALESSKAPENGFATAAGARSAAVITPPPLRASSNPRPSPGALTRQASQPTPPTQTRLGLRKRKTDSLASAESNAPKYRTRSMIIVYYDSAVQTAFEELVKFVSASRNAMRKGKMAVKMAEMRRAAELEVENDDDDGDDGLNDLVTNSGNSLAAQKNVSVSKEGQSQAPGLLAAGDEDSENFARPKLKFVSTRQMGPPRDVSRRSDNLGGMSLGLLRGYRRGGGMGAIGEAPDIFDDLDKGLEWCQSQCEHAAHQFLRDGDCSTEIENIKRKLAEVKEFAEQEVEKLKKEEAAHPPLRPEALKGVAETGKSREWRTPSMRRELRTPKDLDVLEVDDMEVDDEGVDDLELPPKLIFKRSRDIR